jgi:hypothetical protein
MRSTNNNEQTAAQKWAALFHISDSAFGSHLSLNIFFYPYRKNPTGRGNMRRSMTRRLSLAMANFAAALLLFLTVKLRGTFAFTGPASSRYLAARDSSAMAVMIRQTTPLFTSSKNEEEAPCEQEVKGGGEDEASGPETSLTKPTVFNLRKESLLFDENAATRQNNNVRRLWLACQKHLPRVVHGKREGIEPEPLGALYNMLCVRIPAIVAGMVYGFNVSTGHPLIVDLGDGAFEMHPIIVATVLYVLLL